MDEFLQKRRRIFEKQLTRFPKDPVLPYPEPHQISNNSSTVCLLISGLDSRPNDGIFDAVLPTLVKHGIEPILYGYRGPDQDWGLRDTYNPDFGWRSGLTICHLETRPQARRVILLAHSAGGANISDYVGKFGSLGAPSGLGNVAAIVGFAAVLGIPKEAPLMPLPDDGSAPLDVELVNYEGSPTALCRSGIPMLCLMGTQDKILTQEDKDLWDISPFMTRSDFDLQMIEGAGHYDIVPKGVDALDLFITGLRESNLL